MPPDYLKCASADAEDFSTLDDLIDFSNEDINGISVDQNSRQTCSSTSITTNTRVELGGGRDVSNSALSLQKEQLPVMQTSLDSNLSEGLCVPWDDFAEIGWLSQSFVSESFSSFIADMATTDLLVGSHDVNLDIHVREESNIKEDAQANIQDERRSFNFQSGSPISVLESSAYAKAVNGSNNIIEVEEEVASSKCIVNTGGGAATLSHVPGRVRSKRKRTEACLWNAHVLAASNVEADTTAPSFPPLIQSCNSTSYYDRHAFVYDYGDDEADDDQQEGMAGPGAAAHPSVKKKKKIIKPSAATKSKSSTLCANNNHHHARLPAKKASTVHKIRLPTLGEDQGTSKTSCGDDNDRLQISTMRKCLHCGSQTTPQWRVGPMGPKTLCNACGVRYKSGRLLPEYRPAASPTFEEALHSNSHRRVLEMHMQKKLASAGVDSVAPPSLLGAAHENAAYGLSVHAHHGRAPEQAIMHRTTSSSCILMEATITPTNNDMTTSTIQPNSPTVLLPVWTHPKLS